MSWTDEEIDNLFKDGANAQSFEYDNSYFAEMEAASLPVNKKGKDFLWMGTALVFIAVLTTGYFVNDTNNTSFNAANNQLANLELNKTNDKTNNSTTSNESQISNGDQNESTFNAESNDLSDQLSNSESSNSAANVKSAVATNTYSVYSNASNKQNNGFSNPEQGGSPNSMYSIATRNVGASRSNVANQTSGQSDLTGANGAQVLGVNGATNGNLVDSRNDAKVSDQKELSLQSEPITAGLPISDLVQLNQGLNASLAPNALPMLGELRPKAAFYVELNAGLSQSLITPSDFMSKSIGGGVGVESYLGNFNLTTGLNFKASYHNDLFLSREGKVYGFGSTTGMNTYDIQEIYSLELPISLGYNFGKHNLNIGVRTSFVVGYKTYHQAYEEGQVLRSRTMTGRVYDESGDVNYTGGSSEILPRLGVKPTFGYSYHMNKWTIGANVGVQLMKSVNENFMDGFNNQFPVDGQIYLRRTIRLRR